MATKVKTVWQHDMQFEAEAPGGKVTLDAGEDLGGKGKGNRSKPLMLVALAGCTGMDVMSILRKMKIEPEKFVVEIEAESGAEHPKIYVKTHIVYRFRARQEQLEKIEHAVDLSFNKYCGVVAMFKSFSEVTKEIILE